MTDVEKIKILDGFAEKFIQKPMPPEYQKIIDDNFWDLIVDDPKKGYSKLK